MTAQAPPPTPAPAAPSETPVPTETATTPAPNETDARETSSPTPAAPPPPSTKSALREDPPAPEGATGRRLDDPPTSTGTLPGTPAHRDQLAVADRREDQITEISTSKEGISITQTLDSDEKRLSWQERGGSLEGTEVLGVFSMVFGDNFELFGVGVDGANLWLNLRPPNPDENITTWSSSRLGYGGGFHMNFGSINYTGFDPGTMRETSESMDITMFQMRGDLIFGWQWGFGSFLLDSEWRGVVVSVDWKPGVTWVNTIVDGNGNDDFSWNLLGLNFGIAPTTFSSAIEQHAKEAQFRLDFMIIPPIQENMPLFLSLGLGANWY